MSNRKLVKELSIKEDEVEDLRRADGRSGQELGGRAGDRDARRLRQEFHRDTIIKGQDPQVVGDDVWSTSTSSEGVVPKNDFVRQEDIVASKDIGSSSSRSGTRRA
jgi:hypothetical protein